MINSQLFVLDPKTTQLIDADIVKDIQLQKFGISSLGDLYKITSLTTSLTIRHTDNGSQTTQDVSLPIYYDENNTYKDIHKPVHSLFLLLSHNLKGDYIVSLCKQKTSESLSDNDDREDIWKDTYDSENKAGLEIYTTLKTIQVPLDKIKVLGEDSIISIPNIHYYPPEKKFKEVEEGDLCHKQY